MLECHLLISDVSNFFAGMNNSFQILEKMAFEVLCCSQCSNYRHGTPLSVICLINLFSITFLSLANP